MKSVYICALHFRVKASRKHQVMQGIYESEQGWMNDKDEKHTHL